MTRLEQEWALVPVAARWIAVLVALAMTGLLASVFLLPLLAHRGHPGAPAFFVVAMFLLS